MHKLTSTSIFNCPADELYDVVMQVEEYENLFPDHLKNTKVGHHRNGARTIDTTLHLANGISFPYTCTLTPAGEGKIRAEATKSPFSHFGGTLTFRPVGQEKTKLTYELNYKTGFNIVAGLAAPFLKPVIDMGIREMINRLNERKTARPSPARALRP